MNASPSSPSSTRQVPTRLALGVGTPAAFLVLGFGTMLGSRSQLPARVASHFDGTGTADDSMTINMFLTVTGVMIAVGTVFCVYAAVQRVHASPYVAPFCGFMGAFLAGLGAALLVWTTVTQRGLANWRDATGPGLGIVAVTGGALLAGALGAWLGSLLPASDDSPSDEAVTAPMLLADGESAVWLGTIRSRGFLVAAALIGAGAVAAATFGQWTIAGTLAFVSVVMATFSRLQVRADRQGLMVRYGFLRWPSTRVSIDRIETASVVDVRPKQWGGWGYRGSLKLMRRAAVVHRAGPGLRLDLSDGRVFVVTIDHPEQPAALLNAEVART
jgi:hypothetical protein